MTNYIEWHSVERIYLRQSRWCRKTLTIKQTPGNTIRAPMRIAGLSRPSPKNPYNPNRTPTLTLT